VNSHGNLDGYESVRPKYPVSLLIAKRRLSRGNGLRDGETVIARNGGTSRPASRSRCCNDRSAVFTQLEEFGRTTYPRRPRGLGSSHLDGDNLARAQSRLERIIAASMSVST
jgi:hypothetical protein